MIFLRKPTAAKLETIRESQRSLPLTYPEVGATRGTPPTGYVVDHTHAELGRGEATFRAAVAAMREWAPLQLGWVQPAWPDGEISEGQITGTLARSLGLWWLNVCRIVYANEESERFTFAYGTVEGHVECGEERFLVEWDRATNIVAFDILAFSKPGRWMARVGYRHVRRLQRRFARDSVAAMRRRVLELDDD